MKGEGASQLWSWVCSSSVNVLRRAGGPVSFRAVKLFVVCYCFETSRRASQLPGLVRARFFARSCAEHAPGQSTLLLCRARSWSRARSCAEHASLHAPAQSTLLCRARFFARSCAEHASLQTWFEGGRGRVSFRGAFKRVMPSERFRGGRAGACRV